MSLFSLRLQLSICSCHPQNRECLICTHTHSILSARVTHTNCPWRTCRWCHLGFFAQSLAPHSTTDTSPAQVFAPNLVTCIQPSPSTLNILQPKSGKNREFFSESLRLWHAPGRIHLFYWPYYCNIGQSHICGSTLGVVGQKLAARCQFPFFFWIFLVCVCVRFHPHMGLGQECSPAGS